MKRLLTPTQINALAANPAHCSREGLALAPDWRRPFVPEARTQLYYSPVYATLSRTQRLRYNQLFGLRINEFIMLLEADLIERLLPPLLARPALCADAALAQAVATMHAEERLHVRLFAALNRACRPDLYPEGQLWCFSQLPPASRAMLGAVGALTRWAWLGQVFGLWFVMAMEESAKTLALEMRSQPETESLGPLDESFVSVHREHLKDEVRHLHIDAHMLARCLGTGWRARLNAQLFKGLLVGMMRPTRRGSGVQVVRQWVRECPELLAREEELIQAVLALKDDAGYQRSLFNRRIMPETFQLFDATPALAGLQHVLPGYERRSPAHA